MTRDRPKDWKSTWDPLYRGDSAAAVHLPTPSASPSIVRHILYLDGAGRDSPYSSMTEDESIAKQFAGRNGRVYETSVSKLRSSNVQHIARKILIQLLRGGGKGDAQWPSKFEVMQARRYVEEHVEHLADFRAFVECDPAELRRIVDEVFE